MDLIQLILEVLFHQKPFRKWQIRKKLMAWNCKFKFEILAIIANERGAKEATAYDEINYLGFPFSVSETFQQRNTTATLKKVCKG